MHARGEGDEDRRGGRRGSYCPWRGGGCGRTGEDPFGTGGAARLTISGGAAWRPAKVRPARLLGRRRTHPLTEERRLRSGEKSPALTLAPSPSPAAAVRRRPAGPRRSRLP